jgi:hypothetical protein
MALEDFCLYTGIVFLLVYVITLVTYISMLRKGRRGDFT